MDAEADEDVELLSPLSVVIEAARSRVDDEAVGCASASAVGTGVETEIVASCWLMPFCACET